jgi:hypothetical protein
VSRPIGDYCVDTAHVDTGHVDTVHVDTVQLILRMSISGVLESLSRS